MRAPRLGCVRSAGPGAAGLTGGEAGDHLDQEHGQDAWPQQQAGDGLQVKHAGLGDVWVTGEEKPSGPRPGPPPPRPDVGASAWHRAPAPVVLLKPAPTHPLYPHTHSTHTPTYPLYPHTRCTHTPTAPIAPTAPTHPHTRCTRCTRCTHTPAAPACGCGPRGPGHPPHCAHPGSAPAPTPHPRGPLRPHQREEEDDLGPLAPPSPAVWAPSMVSSDQGPPVTPPPPPAWLQWCQRPRGSRKGGVEGL